MKHLVSLLAICAQLAAAPALAQDGNARAAGLARGSKDAKSAMSFLRRHADRIVDANLRKATTELLDKPAPTFMSLHPGAAEREAVRAALAEAGMLDAAVTVEDLFPPVDGGFTFLSAPGGIDDRHHGYPGGLATHTAFNLQAAMDLELNYRARYGIELDHDIVVAAPILHDAFKAWTLQWKKDGTLTKQPLIAGTSSHHVFVVAEAMHRKLPSGFVVALASAHAPPTGSDAKSVVEWIRAAAILAKVDPLQTRVLTKAGDAFTPARLASVEAVINHLSDHDYVLTDPAGAAVAESLERLATATVDVPPDPAALRWSRHRIQSQVAGMLLYSWLRDGGDARVAAELQRRKIPLLSSTDPVTP